MSVLLDRLVAAIPDEPSDDELHHPDLERRRELKTERRKRENDRLQAALDDVAAEAFAMTPSASARSARVSRTGRHSSSPLRGMACSGSSGGSSAGWRSRCRRTRAP